MAAPQPSAALPLLSQSFVAFPQALAQWAWHRGAAAAAGTMASAQPGKFLSAEERRRQRELEEARKAGLAPAEVSSSSTGWGCGSGAGCVCAAAVWQGIAARSGLVALWCCLAAGSCCSVSVPACRPAGMHCR